MKLLKYVMAALLFMLIGFAPLFAQEAGSFGKSDFYVVTIPIERVFNHNKGYIVEYRKTPLVNKNLYLPMDWFVRSPEKTEPLKGEVILMRSGTAWPHLAVYYKEDGTMDHIRLYVRRDEKHRTWGQVPYNPALDSRFDGNITDFKIEY